MIHHAQKLNDLGNATVSGIDRTERIVCTVPVPLELMRRSVWFCVQPYNLFAATSSWSSRGELRFKSAGSLVGLFKFFWGNERAATVTESPVISNRPVSGGSAPVIRIETATGTNWQKYIDVPAYDFDIECDEIELFSSLLTATGNPAWAGLLEVLSQSPP